MTDPTGDALRANEPKRRGRPPNAPGKTLTSRQEVINPHLSVSHCDEGTCFHITPEPENPNYRLRIILTDAERDELKGWL